MNRRDFLNVLTSAGIAAGVAATTSHMTKTEQESTRAIKDVAERILDTRRINCSYVFYANSFQKDSSTGKFSGIFYDLTERVGELANLEINWNAETTYATFAEDLKYGKSDILGSGIWPSPTRATAADFSLPMFYSGVGAYVRKNDHRFDQDLDLINSAKVRIATIDGEMGQIIQQNSYPKASVLSLPQSSNNALSAESVIDGKADVTFLEKPAANLYMKNNPGVLRDVAAAKPIRIFECAWAIVYGSDRLKNILDSSVKEMLSSGYVDEVLDTYGEQDDFYRVRSPIQ